MSQNVKGFCGHIHLRYWFGEISERRRLFKLFTSTFSKFIQLWEPLFSSFHGPTHSSRSISGRHFGKSSWGEPRATKGYWAMAWYWVVKCDARRLMGKPCVGMGWPSERLEAGRAWATVNHAVARGTFVKYWEKIMCVVSHGWLYRYCFLPRKWPLALKRRLYFSW